MKKRMQFLASLVMCIIALSPVWADEEVKPLVPDQTYITFAPIPNDEPMTLLKDHTTVVRLHPRDARDTVYYRILSLKGLSGTEITADISTADTKVEIIYGTGYKPIDVDESMINDNGQFIVKAAVRHQDGSFSEATTAAYNVVIIAPDFATKLIYTPPTQFMVGGQYEMEVTFKTPKDTLEAYASQTWNFIINWDDVRFDKVEYKFPDMDYTSVSTEDVITIPRNFRLLMEQGITLRFTIARTRPMGATEAEVSMGIGRGNFNAAEYLAGDDFKVSLVDRPAADPTFMPTAGYVEKGNTVAIRCATPNTKIYYTTDGTYPTLESTEYTAPVTINNRTTIKALAQLNDGQPDDTSFVSEAEFSVVGIPSIKPVARRVVIDTLVEIMLTDGRGNTLEKGTTKIYYTLDGTEPTSSSTEYTVPFRLKKNDNKLNVIAMKDGDVSPIVTQEYNLVPASPVASRKYGDTLEIGDFITLTCPTADAVIYYTIDKTGEVTKTNGTKYTGPIEFKKSATLRTVAYVGESRSTGVAFSYTVLMAAPVISLPSGVVPYRSRVELSSSSIALTAGSNFPASIAYSIDGTEPTKANVGNLTQYRMPIEITDDITLIAVTRAQSISGWVLSKVSRATYTLNRPAKPTFSPENGEVKSGTKVTLSCETPNVTMYYTVDGSEPTAESTEYKEPIEITEDVTIKAVAISDNPDDAPSREAEASYTVMLEIPWDRVVAKPTFNRASGVLEEGAIVSIACETDSAVIYYTMDGTEPTAESTKYVDPIEITESVTVKAVAIREDVVSEVAEASYIIEKNDPEGPGDPGEPGNPGNPGEGDPKDPENPGTANEDLELAGVSVYPNPSDGELHISLPVAATVEVFTANGVQLQRFSAGAGEITFHLTHSGIHFIRITGEGRTTVKRVVVR